MKRLVLIAFGCLFLSACRQEVTEIAPPTAAQNDLEEIAIAPSDWPWWRGPTRDGHAIGTLPPTVWDEETNVLWSSEIPGRGHASPILCGDQIFLATADEASESLSLLALGRGDGGLLWQTELHHGDLGRKHTKNSFASATAACDGTRVYVAFGFAERLWVSATDLSGAIQWQKDVGPFLADHGYGSSPVVVGGMLFVLADSRGSGFVAALECGSGEIVWRKSRPENDSYSTPVLADLNGSLQFLANGQGTVSSYDPQTGKTNWSIAGPAATTGNTPVWTDSTVIASGGYPGRGIHCIALDDSGQSNPTLQWKLDFKAYVPSSVVIDNRLIVPIDSGIVMCFDVESGKELWKQRLGGDITASPVAIEGHVFLGNEKGETFVFRAGEKFELVAKNKLSERMMASPAICAGRLYLRTDSKLYCIGAVADE